MKQTLRRMLMAAAVLGSMVSAAEAQVQPGMTKYTYIVIVAGPDTKQQFKTLADAMEATFTGQQCTGTGPDLWCDYFTFVENPLVQADVLLVINGDIANNLGNQLDRNTAAYRRLQFSDVKTRAELIRRGVIVAGADGATAYKVLQAGDTIPTLNLLSTFTLY